MYPKWSILLGGTKIARKTGSCQIPGDGAAQDTFISSAAFLAFISSAVALVAELLAPEHQSILPLIHS